MELLGNMRVEGAPSTFISLTEKVELGNVKVERQKLGGDEIVRGGGCKTGTLSVVGVLLGGGAGDWIWGAGSLFTFEGGSPWWRETLTHHAEQKTVKI